MKTRIFAISIIVLMLFASCDGQLSAVMEKFGNNIAGEYTAEVTVGTSAPEKSNDSYASAIGGLLSGGAPVEILSGLTEEDKANLNDLASSNPEAIEAMKNEPLTDAQKESASAVISTAAVVNVLLDNLVSAELLSSEDIPENVKNLLEGIAGSVGSVASKAENPDSLTQADVIGMQAMSGVVNDILDNVIGSIPEEGVSVTHPVYGEIPVKQEDLAADPSYLGLLVQDSDAMSGLLSSSLGSIVENSLDSLTSGIDFMNMMGMTGGVNSNSLISGLL
jgi:hypothetical protein